MTIIIFLIILGMLVFVHELGHFIVAKRAGVEVEEFGFGYPPRALKIGRRWGTLFTLNWIPFGGFVKILGENYEEADSLKPKAESGKPQSSKPEALSFTEVSKKWQAAILAAGVTFNLIFAWVLLSLGFMIGLPASSENDYGAEVSNPTLTIIDVVPESPALEAGLKAGDKIKEIYISSGERLAELTAESVSDFINGSAGEIKMQVERGEDVLDFSVSPKEGIVEGRRVIGIDMDTVGTIKLPIHKSLYEGGKATIGITQNTVLGIANLIKDAVKGEADMSNIAGPVGIVSLVGDASRLGFVYLLTFTALISVNLAVINLVPFPALDGGRIIFVAIEGLIKRPINPKFAGAVNTIGFALLILLMLFVTYRDILRLF